jgi:hypothetical protein
MSRMTVQRGGVPGCPTRSFFLSLWFSQRVHRQRKTLDEPTSGLSATLPQLGYLRTRFDANAIIDGRTNPLEASVAEDLWLSRQSTPYDRPEDWVFASPWTEGKRPLWPDSLLKRWIKPAAKRVGITGKVGWHTFRDTYSTLLRANGEDGKVVQELLRHANSKITMDVYTQALSPTKREAQGRVASSILPRKVVSAVGLSDSFGQLRPRLNSDK